MFTVVITEKGGAQKRLTFEEPEVTIGRVPGNDIVLAKGNVSKRHSRIVLKDSRFIVVDLKSTNGTYVNGRKITSPLVVKEGDKIYIGDFIMTLEGDPAQAAPVEAMRQPSVLPSEDSADSSGKMSPVSGPPPLPSRAPDPLADDGIPAVLRSASGIPNARKTSPNNGVEPPAIVAPHRVPVPVPIALPSMPPVLSSFDGDPEPMLDRTQAQASAPDVNGLVGLATEQREAMRPMSVSEPLTAPDSSAPTTDAPPKAGSERGSERAAPHSVPPVLSARTSSIPPATRDDLRSLMLRLGRDLDTDNADPDGLLDEKRWQRAERAIQGKLGELTSEGAIARSVDKALLASAALHEAVGLGPLDGLLAEEEVQQVIIERFDRVRVDRGTGLKLEETAFSSPQALLVAVRRLLAQGGIVPSVPLKRSEATFDLSLPNGLHIVGALPAAATEGPVLSVRRRPRKVTPLSDLRRDALLDAEQMKRLTDAIAANKNLLFVGPRATDLASMMSSVLDACPKDERIALFEYGPEVALGERSAICLKRGVATLSELHARARHFRPERCVIHEVSRAEIVPTITTLLSGSNGSMASMERPSAREALTELGLAAHELGADGVDQLQRAVHLVVGLVREGTRVRLAGMYTLVVEAGALKLIEL